MRAKFIRGKVADAVVVNFDQAAEYKIETLQQLGERTFAGTGGPHHRHDFSRFDFDV